MAGPRFIDADYRGPRKIERYRLVSGIAAGGQATVVLASPRGGGGLPRRIRPPKTWARKARPNGRPSRPTPTNVTVWIAISDATGPFKWTRDPG